MTQQALCAMTVIITALTLRSINRQIVSLQAPGRANTIHAVVIEAIFLFLAACCHFAIVTLCAAFAVCIAPAEAPIQKSSCDRLQTNKFIRALARGLTASTEGALIQDNIVGVGNTIWLCVLSVD